MDKGRRRELKILHYKRRVRKIPLLKRAGERSYHAYLSHSTPCSCWCCRSEKYNRVRDGKCMSEPAPTPEEDERMMEIWRECNFDE